MKLRSSVVGAVVALAGLASVRAEEKDKTSSYGIAWYATWERALRVAKETGRPIMLLAAAPQCHGISGLW
jgi:hypothetical protein